MKNHSLISFKTYFIRTNSLISVKKTVQVGQMGKAMFSVKSVHPSLEVIGSDSSASCSRGA